MSRKAFSGISLAAALLVATVLGAGALAQVTASVEVQDQSGDGTTATVPQASVSGGDGWVVIHQDDNGKPGPVIGQTFIQEGQSSDVTVQFDQPLSSSQKLYAMIHEDNPADQQYTFPDDGDVPVQADGGIVVKPFEYTVGEEEEAPLPDTSGISLLTMLLAGGTALLALGIVTGYFVRRYNA